MTRPTTASLTAKFAVFAVSVAYACLISAAVATAAEVTIAYQPESITVYQQQLAGGQVQAVTINKAIRSLRVTLKDGSHVLVKYPPHEEPAQAAALAAKHVPVIVLTPKEAKKEAAASKTVHHKIRYIVGGILIVVVVVVGSVLFISRRRRALED